MKKVLLSFLLIFLCLPNNVHSAEAYWLDQYNALLYLGTFRLDSELQQMKEKGSTTLLLHSDSLPTLISRYIAWRAKVVGNMDSIAWIQRPSKNKLNRVANLTGFKGVQIDDHYFNKPPVSLTQLRVMLDQKELWCSFQPRQFTHQLASKCDHADVQIYRKTCFETVDMALRMGITGHLKIKVAAYDDGSVQGGELLKCIEKDLSTLRTGMFVFKWKNQEAWISKIKFVFRNSLLAIGF